MTSKSSFFNFGLLRETLRRNIWAITLALLGFIFTLPLLAGMCIQTVSIDYYNTTAQHHAALVEQVGNVMGMGNIAVKIVMIAMAVVCAISVFAYLHTRQKTDFYHSLPISRGKLFISLYAAGAAIVLPCYLLMQLMAYLIAAASGAADAIAASMPLETMATHIVFFLAIYALSVLCVVLCGNTIVSLLLLGWAAFSPTTAFALWDMLKRVFYQTYTYMSDFSDVLMLRLSPVIQYVLVFRNFDMEPAHAGRFIWAQLGIYLLVAVALTVLAYFLFVHRKSERAGAAIAFRGLAAPLKFWCCTLMAVGVGGIFYNIVDQSELWLFFGFAVGGVLTHFLMEIIYHFDFKALLHNWKALLVYAGVFAVFMLGMHMDITGFDTYLPDLDEIAAVDVQHYNGYRGDISRYARSGEQGEWSISSSSQPDLSDLGNIEAVRRLAQSGIEALDTIDQDEYYDGSVRVRYLTTSGKQISRQYELPFDAHNDAIFNGIRFSEEYIRSRNPAFTFEPTGRDQINVYTMLEEFDRYSSSASMGGKVNMNQDQVEEILEALRADILRLTPARAAQEAPVLKVLFTAQEENERIRGTRYIRHTGAELAVYPSYTQTLALIKRYTGVTPADLSDFVVSAQLIMYEDTERNLPDTQDLPAATAENTAELVSQEYSTRVTDPDDLETLLENAIVENSLRAADYLYKTEPYVLGENTFYVSVQLASGESYDLYYPAGNAPEQVFEQYFP